MKQIGLLILVIILSSFNLYSQGNGTYHQFDLEVDGLAREYTLYVPEGYDGSEEWPVVFCLHAFVMVVDNMIVFSRMFQVADTAKFFIVYPQGLPVIKGDGVTYNGWHVPDNWTAEQDDIKFINSIIDDLIAKPEFVIDLNRIHATGYSLGGNMSFYLAFELSNRIASVAGVASQMSDTLINHICTPQRKISVLHIQGTDDYAFPEEGDQYCLPLFGVTEYWASINGCDEVPDSTELEDINTSDSSTVTLFNYNNCDNDYEVLLYRINGGGHFWPGAWKNPDGPYLGVLNYDINASAEIWNFFARNPHPNPWVEIPDTAFLHALIEEGVDTNGDGLISYEEAEEVMSLNINGHFWLGGNIEDMTGIEAFVHLDTLRAKYQPITNIDLSNNKALRYLDLGGTLTTLDLSQNIALEVFICVGLDLGELDLSDNLSLKYLDCAGNKLTQLDLSENTALQTLICDGNELTELDFSNNSLLKELYIGDSPTCRFPGVCFLGPNPLSKLNIENCTSLTHLNVDGADLTDLDVSGCTALKYLSCIGNQLTSLDVSRNTALNTLGCHDNQISSLVISTNAALENLDCSWNLLTNVDVSGCNNLKEYSCYHNQLISLDVSNNTGLIQLLCGDNQLISLDVSKNTALIDFSCGDNQLTSLDVSSNTSLDMLGCDNNFLTGLDVSNNTGLIHLGCCGNLLTSLDISNNTTLYGLYITDMPSLHQVCVWEGFPGGKYPTIDKAGSPNVYFTTECTIGVEEHSSSNISIYPNPTHTLLTIEAEQLGPYSIAFTSLNGRLLYHREYKEPTIQLNLSSFQKGVYFITIRNKDCVTTRKIIKL